MKVTFRTIKDGQFEKELEPATTVEQLKALVNEEKGLPTEAMKIIYQGKILVNTDTLESINFKESNFLVVMATKPKAAPAPAPAAAPAAATTSSTAAADSSSTPAAAPAAAPAATEQPAAQGASTEGANEDESDLSSPRTLDPNSPLAFLSTNAAFRQLRATVQQRPIMLPSLMQRIAAANPQLVELINQHQEDFYILINSDAEDADEGSQSGGLQVTPEEEEAIGRLTALGFDRSLAAQAYFACDKNENSAANWLMEHGAEMS